MKERPQTRLINFRSFFIVALSIIAAILFLWLNLFVSPLGFILFAAEIALLLALYIYYAYRRAPKYKQFTFILALVLAVFAGIHFYIRINETLAHEKTMYLINGQADEINYERQTILLTDISLDGESVRGKILLHVDFEEYHDLYSLRVGDYLIFESHLRQNPVLRADNKINARAHRTQIKYHCYELSETVVIVKAQGDLFQRIGEAVKHNLTLAMGSEHGSVAYAMFTGDKSGVSEEMRDAYTVSGMGHVMAVSGLHIGFLTAMLLGFFKLFRLKKLPANLITMAILLLYAFFTGFSPSVIRAVTMAFVMLTAMIFSKRYDTFNAFCGATALILLISPIYLFDVGFLLSISAVFGIILFSRAIKEKLLKIKCPRLLANSTAVSVSAQLGILPVMIMYFGRVQIYSVFLNILLMPLIAVAFMLILSTLLLSFIARPLIVLLRFSGLTMAFIDTAAVSAARLPFASVPTHPAIGVFIMVCYLLYFAASRFFMLPKKKIKTAVSAAALSLCGIMIIGSVFSVSYYKGETYLSPADSFGEVTTFVRHNERNYIIGDFNNYNAMDNTLKKLNIKRVDGVFIFALSPQTAANIARLSKNYPLGKIFAHENADLSGFTTLTQNKLTNFYLFSGAESVVHDVAPVVVGERLIAYELLTEKGGILFCGYRTNYTHIPPEVIDRCFAIRSFMFLNEFPARIFITNMERGFRETGEPAYQFTNAEQGSFIFNFANGNVYALR